MAAERRKPISRTDSIDELFRCPICLDNLSNPKTLTCGHVFCLQCLQREEQLQENGFLKNCPICRKPPAQGVKAELFPKAYMAQQMMDRVSNLRATGATDAIIDKVLSLITIREEMKKEEETKAKQSLREEKRNIEQNVEEVASDLLRRVKETLDLRKNRLLKNIERSYEEKIDNIRKRIKKVDDYPALSAWLKASITDEPEIADRLMKVLPMETQELDKKLREEHSHMDILMSMDPCGTIQSLADSKELSRLKRQNRLDDEGDEDGDVDDGPKSLVSNEPSVSSRGVADSISEKTTCPCVSEITTENRRYNVIVQRWIKDEIDGGSNIREGAQAGSTMHTDQWVLQLPSVRGRCEGALMRFHMSGDFTCIATEQENNTSEMRVYSNANTNRRRHLLSPQNAERQATGIVAVTTLPDNDGWCMLFKSALFMFDYHGCINVEHHFDADTSILCATSPHKRGDQFIYVNGGVFKIGLISTAGGNITKNDLKSDALFRGGMYFDMTSTRDALFIAHTQGEIMDGNITCYAGLESQYYLKKWRCINPPSGFAEVSHPVSLCCNQTGTLFALWRDKNNRRGIVMEYVVEDMESLHKVAIENANDIVTITCSHEGYLVAGSLKS